MITIKKAINFLFGFVIGFINSLLGAGGGMIAVPLLRRSNLSQNEAHASAVAVIFPLTVISAVLYLYNGYVQISDSFPFIALGVVGAIVGAYALKKVPSKLLKRIFGIFMIYAGVRMLFR